MNDKDKQWLITQATMREEGALFIVEMVRTIIGSLIVGIIAIAIFWLLGGRMY